MSMDAGLRREMIPGPSLLTWGRIMVISLIWIVVGGVATLALLLTSEAIKSHTLTAAFHIFSDIWFVTFLFATLGSVLGSSTRAKAELAAGYTTVPYRNQEVDLVDTKTGIVLRAAGEPLFDRAGFKTARRAARLAANANITNPTSND